MPYLVLVSQQEHQIPYHPRLYCLHHLLTKGISYFKDKGHLVAQ